MVKNSVVASVSIQRDQAEFIDRNNLSISDLIQEKIEEQMRLFEVHNTDKAKIIRVKEMLEREVQLMSEFLEYISKFEDWRKWRAEQTKDVV